MGVQIEESHVQSNARDLNLPLSVMIPLVFVAHAGIPFSHSFSPLHSVEITVYGLRIQYEAAS